MVLVICGWHRPHKDLCQTELVGVAYISRKREYSIVLILLVIFIQLSAMRAKWMNISKICFDKKLGFLTPYLNKKEKKSAKFSSRILTPSLLFFTGVLHLGEFTFFFSLKVFF